MTDVYKSLIERAHLFDEEPIDMIKIDEEELKKVQEPPEGVKIIEINHPIFPLGLVGVDKNDERYILTYDPEEDIYKWDVAA